MDFLYSLLRNLILHLQSDFTPPFQVFHETNALKLFRSVIGHFEISVYMER